MSAITGVSNADVIFKKSRVLDQYLALSQKWYKTGL